jgi:rhodanese-related sulfurtransferase
MKLKVAVAMALGLALTASACSYEEERPARPSIEVMPVPSRVDPNAPTSHVLPPAPPMIDATALKARLDSKKKTTIVCTRSADDQPVIKGAIMVEEDSIVDWAKKFPKDAFIAVYCTCTEDQSSSRAVRLLRDAGYENSFVIERGLKAWLAIDGPVTGGKPAKPVAGSR